MTADEGLHSLGNIQRQIAARHGEDHPWVKDIDTAHDAISAELQALREKVRTLEEENAKLRPKEREPYKSGEEYRQKGPYEPPFFGNKVREG